MKNVKWLLFTLGSMCMLMQNFAFADGGYFHLPPGSPNVSKISQTQYAQILTDFQNQWFSIVYKKTGKPLIVKQDWQSPFFGAFSMDRKDYWEISLWGGMARAPGASLTSLQFILCHELGHIIGGEPRQTIPGSEWASVEGQADFFAASVCMPQTLKIQSQLKPSADAELICDQHTRCGLIADAGLNLVLFFQKYSYRENPLISFFTPAPASDVLIRNSYPSDQCRLDTYISGAKCTIAGEVCAAPNCWKP